MNFISAECPNCGGQLQVPDNIDKVSCIYCKADIILKKDDASGDKIKTLSKLVETEMAAKNLEEAYEHCNSILELDNSNAYAWINKGHCKTLWGSESEAVEYYKKAIDFSSEKIKTFSDIFDIVNKNSNDLLSQISKSTRQKHHRLVNACKESGTNEYADAAGRFTDFNQTCYPGVGELFSCIVIFDALSTILSSIRADSSGGNDIADLPKTFACPCCNQEYELDPSFIGKKVECTQCQHKFVVSKNIAGSSHSKDADVRQNFYAVYKQFKIEAAKTILFASQACLAKYNYCFVNETMWITAGDDEREFYREKMNYAKGVLAKYGVSEPALQQSEQDVSAPFNWTAFWWIIGTAATMLPLLLSTCRRF